LENVLNTTTCLYLSNNSKLLGISSATANSMYASAINTIILSGTFLINDSGSSCGKYVPDGLLGLQIHINFVLSVISSYIASKSKYALLSGVVLTCARSMTA